jgi:hypothetical protein
VTDHLANAYLTSAATRTGDIADVIGKLNDIGPKLVTAESTDPFMYLNFSTGPTDELVEDFRKSKDSFNNIIVAITAEFNSRLESIIFETPYRNFQGNAHWSESLKDMVLRCLPKIEPTDRKRMKGLTQSFLWLIIKMYVQQKVAIRRTWAGTEVGLMGINTKQYADLQEMFGPNSDWVYTMPVTMVPLGADVLQMMGARETRTSAFPPR